MLLKEALHLFEESLYDGRVKERTRRWYIWFDERGRVHGMLRSLYLHFGDVPIEEIDVFSINRWIKKAREPQSKWGKQRPAVEGQFSPNTINGLIVTAKRFFGWLEEMNLLASNPAQNLRRIPMGQRMPRAIHTNDFVNLLEDVAATSRQPERDIAILTFLFDTGCRVGGLCNIKMSDMVLNKRRVFLREKGRGYNGKGRWVFLEDTPFLAVSTYLKVRPSGIGTNLFLSKKGALGTSGVYQMIERHARNIGIKGFWNPHSFRHAAAREWLRGGASLPAVAKLLGHNDIQTTTLYYAQWADSELQQIKHEASPFNDQDVEQAVSRVLQIIS